MVENHNGTRNSRNLVEQPCETVGIKLIEHPKEIIGGELAESHSSTDDNKRFDGQLRENKIGSEFVKHPYELVNVSLIKHPKERFSGESDETHGSINYDGLVKQRNERVRNEMIVHFTAVQLKSDILCNPYERAAGELVEHFNERFGIELVEDHNGTVDSSELVD